MLTIEKLPKTYRGRPCGWYAADWSYNRAFCYRTLREALAKARSIHHGRDKYSIVNVGWLARPGEAIEQIGRSFTVSDFRQ